MIDGCDRLSHLPDNIGLLLELQTLPIFIVGTGKSQSLGQLYRLALRGRAKHSTVGKSNRTDANLRNRPKLRSIGFSWGSNHDESMMRNEDNTRLEAEGLLKCLQPHRNLKTLTIEADPGGYFPRWIGASEIPNLTNIELIYCKQCEHPPPLGQLPFLNVIYMCGMLAVKNIGSNSMVEAQEDHSSHFKNSPS
ncbi:hypothetical protein Patl1_26464 [Pistacia atlantica]|uniref:Uncharacterized protein n=1 Tax=Pistacia atlantica TaxID=434234 RepID=A0ACC1B2B6_9ROSI|nr:hypothetical protein Patl1_26464 [Pistacia atlantica]